jgi:hypothetical protein
MEGDSKELNQTLSPSIDISVGSKEIQDFISPWAKVHLFLGICSIIFTIFLMDNSSINYKNLISPGLYLITGVIGILSPITSKILPFMILLIVLFTKSLINIGLYIALISIVTYNTWEIIVFLVMIIVNALLMAINFLAFANSRKSCDNIFS